MTARRSARSVRTEAAALTTTMITVFAGVTIVTPLLPAYRSRWHLSVSATTALFVVYVAGVAVALVGLGRLADVLGHRVVVLVAVLGCDAAAVLSALAPGEGWLVAARVLQGLAVGLVPGAVAVALTAILTTGVAARLVSFATVGGIATGLLVGAAFAGVGVDAVWAAYLVLLAPVTGWIVLAAVRAGGDSERRPSTKQRRLTVQRPVLPIDGRRAFCRALVTVALTFAAMGLFAGLGPLLLRARSDSVVVGAGISVSAYVVSGLVQLVVDSGAWAVPAGVGALAAGLAALAAAVPLNSLPLLLGAAVLVGAANGLLLPATLATATRLAPAAQRAGTISTYYLALYAGIAVPLLGFGAVADATSLTVAAQLFAAVVGVAAVAVSLQDRAPPSVRTVPS